MTHLAVDVCSQLENIKSSKDKRFVSFNPLQKTPQTIIIMIAFKIAIW